MPQAQETLEDKRDLERATLLLTIATQKARLIPRLRHTQATMQLERGVPLKAIAERLGHSNPSVTQNIYAHVTPHMQDQTLEVAEYILSLKQPRINVVGE